MLRLIDHDQKYAHESRARIQSSHCLERSHKAARLRSRRMDTWEGELWCWWGCSVETNLRVEERDILMHGLSETIGFWQSIVCSYKVPNWLSTKVSEQV